MLLYSILPSCKHDTFQMNRLYIWCAVPCLHVLIIGNIITSYVRRFQYSSNALAYNCDSWKYRSVHIIFVNFFLTILNKIFHFYTKMRNERKLYNFEWKNCNFLCTKFIYIYKFLWKNYNILSKINYNFNIKLFKKWLKSVPKQHPIDKSLILRD